MSAFSGQKIVVVCDFTERMKEVIVHGVQLAEILNKELCLISFSKNELQKSEKKERIGYLVNRLHSQFPKLEISRILLGKSLKNNISELVEKYNAVLVVLHQSEVKHQIKAFRLSRIPFLFVNGNEPDYLKYKQVLIPLDYRKASKETSLWASYFGRFNHSLIQVIYANEKSHEQYTRLMRNLNFFKNFLQSVHVKFRFVEGTSSSWGICKETIQRAKELQGEVLIFSGSNNITLVDLLIGLPEKKLISMAGTLPVLLINPRKDICMLCD